MGRSQIFASASFVAIGAIVATLVACASKHDHPGNPGLECNPGIPCHVGAPGGVTGQTPADGGVDVGVVDAGPNSISLPSNEVHSGTSFTHDPKSDPLDTVDPLATLYVTGSVARQGTVTGGLFAIPSVDAPPNEFAWIELFDSKSATFDTRTIGHVLHDTTTAETIPGPLYFPMYPTDLNATMGATVGVTKPLGGTATIIVQLVDSTGAAIQNATASMPSASTTCTVAAPAPECGPFYDNGDGIVAGAGTGANGTIVFLGVDGAGAVRTSPNFAVVTVTKSGGTPTPLPKMAIIQNAYSWVRVTLK